jgi:hypothetical protein
MNERIQELADQCHHPYSEHRIDLKKFAELIVRECARVYWHIDDGELHGKYVVALKEHFG